MEQQLTIKQIAQLAGVSVGTVDRVLHNRGKVSDKALAAVQAVLDTQSYRYNIHTSAVAFKKTGKSLHLLISIPSSKRVSIGTWSGRGSTRLFVNTGTFPLCAITFSSISSARCLAGMCSIKSLPSHARP